MNSNPRKQQRGSKVSHFLLSIARFFVSASLDHAERSRWVVVIVLIILLISGELFKKTGLIALLIIIPSYILLYYLKKWLDKYEE
jgi:ABC-type bacteriocin/lantibiotic exporter with double-glycine peptidase domain